MKSDLLLELANHLDTIDPSVFDLGRWKSQLPVNECGHAGCAIGHGSDIFWDMGLRLAKDDAGTFIPTFNNYRSWRAVEKFFDLNEEESKYLFAERKYEKKTLTLPSEVSDRIRNFIKGNNNVGGAESNASGE
jgi:hypothetical protein